MTQGNLPGMNLVSLFSGVGGLDEGLHRAGFSSVFCSEIDAYARSTLERFLEDEDCNPWVNDDINALDASVVADTLDLPDNAPLLLAGGPPCQSFSLIGARGSVDDPRGQLIFKMVEYADALKPHVVLMEQVKGLLSAALPGGKKGSVLELIIRSFKDIGYHVEYKVLNAADYGIPQLRERLFLIASRFPGYAFPSPTHTKRIFKDLNRFDSPQLELISSLAPHKDLASVISHLPSPWHKDELSAALDKSHIDITTSRDRERIHGVPEGCCLAQQLHLPKSQRMNLCPKKDTTKFRRLSWDLPSLTLRGGEVFYHPEEDRYLTPREYALIHTFSESRVFLGPIRSRSGSFKGLDQHRQIANSVPPQIGKILGESIRSHIQRYMDTTVVAA